MTTTDMTAGAVKPEPLRTTRTFAAPRELVFKAWSLADHVKRWFCPAGFTAPEARIEMRVGGPFEVCMRAPDGTDHWTRGVFAELEPVERLELDLHATDAAGRILFYAYTEVSFHTVCDGTRMDVVQSYTLLVPEAAAMVKGAPMGWSQTLDKLEQEVSRMAAQEDEIERSVAHGTFDVSRSWDAPVERVYRALTDAAAKSRWFRGPPGWTEVERSMDVRPGGRERLVGRWENGRVSAFDATYHDVVPLRRLVYCYEMHVDGRKISVSLATAELTAEGPGRTTLKITEQGAFLDGYDDMGARQHGTGQLLDMLGASLAD
jgi:uncharacterized protein YndB with AHSA1/START domain